MIPEQAYIAHLLDDLKQDLKKYKIRQQGREISTIFIGGGTPSLLSVDAMHLLLSGVKTLVPVKPDAEITMEANPGTVEANKFAGFVEAGVNRISIGVQSFENDHLTKLGRIHDSQQAIKAIELAKQLPLRSFNTDLMHGLPEQNAEQALNDLRTTIALGTPHISWYQLTIEPNTQFFSKPPELPDDDVLWEIQQQGHALLEENGYQQYEVSAYTKNAEFAQHNLNYWRFGDYLGIGCGAHGKITDLVTKQIMRTVKVKHPIGYMDLSKDYLDTQSPIQAQDLAFEFFMNRFRLLEACEKEAYTQNTGQPLSNQAQSILKRNVEKGLIDETSEHWQVTDLGRRYLNSLLADFV